MSNTTGYRVVAVSADRSLLSVGGVPAVIPPMGLPPEDRDGAFLTMLWWLSALGAPDLPGHPVEPGTLSWDLRPQVGAARLMLVPAAEADQLVIADAALALLGA